MVDPIAYATISIALSSWGQLLLDLERAQSQKGFTPEAETHMIELKKLLIPLEDVGNYLKEAKRFHDILNRLTPHITSLKSTYDMALNKGIFTSDDFNMGDFVMHWNNCKTDYMELLHFLTDEMKYIASPIQTNEGIGPYRGEKWLIAFFSTRDKLNAFQKRRESGNSSDKIALADEINALHATWMLATTKANAMIRTRAAEISEGFLILAHTLKLK